MLWPPESLTEVLGLFPSQQEESRVHPVSVDFLGLLRSTAASSRFELDALVRGQNASQQVSNTSNLAEDVAKLHSQVSVLGVEAREKKRVIIALEQCLAEAKSREEKCRQDAAKDKANLLQQLESSRVFQHDLVNKLLAERVDLSHRCCVLEEQLRSNLQEFEDKFAKLQEKSSKEVESQRRSLVIAERSRREAWEKEKVKEIKDMTIRGLEPELERLVLRRQEDKQKLHEEHIEALDQQHSEMQAWAEREVSQLRDRLKLEHEQTLSRERDMQRQKEAALILRHKLQLHEERLVHETKFAEERMEFESHIKARSDSLTSQMREVVVDEVMKNEGLRRSAAQYAREAANMAHAGALAFQGRTIVETDAWKQDHVLHVKAEVELCEQAFGVELQEHHKREVELIAKRMRREHSEALASLERQYAAEAVAAKTTAWETINSYRTQLEVALSALAATEAREAALLRMTGQLEMERNQGASRLEDCRRRALAREETTEASQQQGFDEDSEPPT